MKRQSDVQMKWLIEMAVVFARATGPTSPCAVRMARMRVGSAAVKISGVVADAIWILRRHLAVDAGFRQHSWSCWGGSRNTEANRPSNSTWSEDSNKHTL